MEGEGLSAFISKLSDHGGKESFSAFSFFYTNLKSFNLLVKKKRPGFSYTNYFVLKIFNKFHNLSLRGLLKAVFSACPKGLIFRQAFVWKGDIENNIKHQKCFDKQKFLIEIYFGRCRMERAQFFVFFAKIA